MRRPAGIVTRSFSATAARPAPHGRAPLPPPAVATSAPTPAYRRHHDVLAPQVDSTAFHPGWRVSTRLDSLLEAGRISREGWDRAQEWRRWAEMVTPYRAQRWDVRVDIAAVVNDAGMLIRTRAATKLREAATALGELRIRILAAVLVEDVCWSELGRRLRLSDKTGMRWAAEAIEALAEHCAGRPVPPPPVLRYRNQPGAL